jgi:carboxyl-terminal processing protease
MSRLTNTQKLLLGCAAVFVALVCCLAGAAGGFLGRQAMIASGRPPSSDVEEQFEIFWEAWNTAEKHYVDPEAVDPEGMTYGAIQGMLDALGDVGHTRFLSREEVMLQVSDITGQFQGIGAEVSIRYGRPVIVAPFDGSPAQRAGIRAGDVILKIDGEDTAGMSVTRAVQLIRGPKGEAVELTVLHEGETQPMEITVVRDVIKIPVVSWQMVPSREKRASYIAHVRISQFAATVDEDLAAALEGARNQGAQAIILDLRNNPGGLLDQALDLANQFLESGVVVLQEDREGKRKAYEAKPGGLAVDLPLAVLINQGSASASEITAGAVQDNERGVVIGTTTFGTGTILQTFQLSDGSAVLLAVAQWLTPDGREIKGRGIEPDILVELPVGTSPLRPGSEAEETWEGLVGSQDVQLLRAIEELSAEVP